MKCSVDRLIDGSRNCGLVFVVDVVFEFVLQFFGCALDRPVEALASGKSAVNK